MEIFGGFIIMMCILGLLVVAAWLVTPLVLFCLKMRQDRILSAVTRMEKRLAVMEEQLAELQPVLRGSGDDPDQLRPDPRCIEESNLKE